MSGHGCVPRWRWSVWPVIFRIVRRMRHARPALSAIDFANVLKRVKPIIQAGEPLYGAAQLGIVCSLLKEKTSPTLPQDLYKTPLTV